MNRFSKLHPFVLLLFFAVTLIIPLSFRHPLISVVSLVFALLYALVSRQQSFWKTLLFSLAVTGFIGLFNMLFAHYGVDVLFTVGDTRFTLEALLYGLNQGTVAAAVLLWFTALGRCLDSEKLLYLFRFAPKCALLFSMVLGFIPRFLHKLSDIREAQLALSGGRQPQGLREKFRAAANTFSALITYSLESSIITANSMTARGYQDGAVRAGRFRWQTEDVVILCVMLVFTVETVWQKISGNLTFIFEPKPTMERLSIAALVCFALLQALPSALILWENAQWKLSSVKN